MKMSSPAQKRRERRISGENWEGRTRERVSMARDSAMAMGSARNLHQCTQMLYCIYRAQKVDSDADLVRSEPSKSDYTLFNNISHPTSFLHVSCLNFGLK